MKALKVLIVIVTVTLCLQTLWGSEDAETDLETGPIERVCPDTPPKPIYVFPARYPPEASINLIEGKVVVQCVVTTEGNTRDIEVLESFPEGVFDKDAIEAVKRYRFNPETKNCKPVEAIINIPIIFDANVFSSYDYYEAFKKGRQKIENREFEEAIDTLSAAINIYHKHSPSFYLRGLAYWASGNNNKALLDFKRAIKLDPDVAIYYNIRGSVYSSMENFENAIEDFSRAIEIKPDLTEPYFNRGDAYRLSTNYEDAIADYSKTISMGENNIQAHNNRVKV
ncbi:MAG: TonB family protein [Syntrophaceae bacterium]|nr:TonB family protein [Syntrophaceae bacterium]